MPLTEMECARAFANRTDLSPITKFKLIKECLDGLSSKDIAGFRTPKQNKQSETHRAKGNEYYCNREDRNLLLALENYNRSICWAPLDSENLALGYANRSAVYFVWEKWETCVENIELARECAGFPEAKLKSKLDEREEKCKMEIALLKDKEKPIVIDLKLSYEANKIIPDIVDCVEFQWSAQNTAGRLVATQNLKIGDVLSIERSFVVQVESKYSYQRCTFCSFENILSLIPCDNCTKVMFCSEKCRELGNKYFHRFECAVVDGIAEYVEPCHEFALRVVLKVFSDEQELVKVKCHVESRNRDKPYNIFMAKETSESISEHYKAIHAYNSNQFIIEDDEARDELGNWHVSDLGAGAAIMACVEQDAVLKRIFAKDQRYFKLFFELLYRNFNIARTSTSEAVNVCMQENGNVQEVTYGMGLFRYKDCLRHSCTPNVLGFATSDSAYVTIATRKIKKGEQLFHNMLSSPGKFIPREERNELLKNFDITCTCIACDVNTPDYLPLEPSIPAMELYSRIGHMEGVCNKDKRRSMQIIDEMVKFLSKYDIKTPCQQTYFATRNLFASCYDVYAGKPAALLYELWIMRQNP